MKIISTLSNDEVDKLLNKRESYLQYNPIFLPIIGARRFWDSTFGAMTDYELQSAFSIFFPRYLIISCFISFKDYILINFNLIGVLGIDIKVVTFIRKEGNNISRQNLNEKIGPLHIAPT